MREKLLPEVLKRTGYLSSKVREFEFALVDKSRKTFQKKGQDVNDSSDADEGGNNDVGIPLNYVG